MRTLIFFALLLLPGLCPGANFPLLWYGDESFLPHKVSGSSARIYASNTNANVMLHGSGLTSGASNAAAYAVFYTNITASDSVTIDAEITLTEGRLPVSTEANWPGNGGVHMGIGLRWASSSEFAGLVMLSAESDELQVVNRVGGVETNQIRLSVAGGIDYNKRYRLVIIDAADSVTANLYNWRDSTLLAQTNFTIPAAITNLGKPFLHTFSGAMAVNWIALTQGVWVMKSPWPLSSTLGTVSQFPRGYSANDRLWLYVNNTNGGGNGYGILQSPVLASNFTMTGTANLTNGRIWGVIFRTAQDGSGLFWRYDANGPNLQFGTGNVAFATVTIMTNFSVTALSKGLGYNFSLVVSNTTLSFGVAGRQTNTVITSDYNRIGTVGLKGFQAEVIFTNLNVFIPPTVAQLSGFF